ncbi:endonuclease III [Methanoplanus sp. FWC-SCC4]|uniref:Endonuclease III n=1 Tax=Methanochimaera problematica TaxID=2609417 RepID=A0AA97I406_9EURY|nr:endonuclease III [Methanoplanus sp. FWC-SCC4]WOF16451.1 endonuclease III [Methanoplanus sp. FWC-SCC4]
MHSKTACKIYSVLAKIYLNKDTKLNFLDFDNPYQILIMTILSAQTTDKTVNSIKGRLFEKYPGPEDLGHANQEDVEEIIKSTGFYHAKAKNIISSSKMICSDFNCEIPKTISELTKLPGVGRKTANIVLNHAFRINEGIAVDTHVKRVAFRTGMTENTDPKKIETDLTNLFPKSTWEKINFLLISHGRAVCDAKKPACDKCEIKDLCRYYMEKST